MIDPKTSLIFFGFNPIPVNPLADQSRPSCTHRHSAVEGRVGSALG